MTKKLDRETLALLSTVECTGNTAKITSGKLDRAVYLRLNEAIQAAGGTWNRRTKAHVFSGDAAVALEPVILTGEFIRPQDFGFFETPPAIVRAILDSAAIRSGLRVLEPSAGRGAIAGPMARTYGVDLHCIEIREEHAEALHENVVRQAGARTTVSIRYADFLRLDPAPMFDRIVMNPPFSPPRYNDVRHVWHALEFLKADGVLIAVMSAGIGYREDGLTRNLRERLQHMGATIEPLPEGSFSVSGTNVNTVIVTVRGRPS